MELSPQLLFAKVMHQRVTPRKNGFWYHVYYLTFPFSQRANLSDGWRFGVNRKGLMSFWEKDYGPRDGSPIRPWLEEIFTRYGMEELCHGEVVLVTMPRVLGYGFNPVSFWLCHDQEGVLRAVIAEVHNTFGEHHSYLCAHADGKPITGEEWMEAEKLFHVSPFMQREGYYSFRFDYRPEQAKLGVWIDYYAPDGTLLLLTSVMGSMVPYTRANLWRAFWQVPLVTVKTIALIHWQAVRLWVLKRIPYVPKPRQIEPKISTTRNITKMSSSGKNDVKAPPL